MPNCIDVPRVGGDSTRRTIPMRVPPSAYSPIRHPSGSARCGALIRGGENEFIGGSAEASAQRVSITQCDAMERR